MKYNKLQLQGNIEELQETISAMTIRYEILYQEKEILSVERDEMIKRFLPSYGQRKIS